MQCLSSASQRRPQRRAPASRRGLLEVEQRQAPARGVDDGRRGRINIGALYEQTRMARRVSLHPDDHGGGQVT
jgi:hypothetical protein